MFFQENDLKKTEMSAKLELNSKSDEGALVCTCPAIEPLPNKNVDCIHSSLI